MTYRWICKCGAAQITQEKNPKAPYLSGLRIETFDGVLCDACSNKKGKPIFMYPVAKEQPND